MSRRFWCENKFGGDACELAKAGRIFDESELPFAMDGGNPQCPGRTLSGNACGSVLVALPSKPDALWKKIWKPIPLLAMLLVFAVAMAVILLAGGTRVGTLQVVSNPVHFARSGARAELRLRNGLGSPVYVERIDLSPPAFSYSAGGFEIPPATEVTRSLRYESAIEGISHGEALIYVSGQSEPVRVQLIAGSGVGPDESAAWAVYDAVWGSRR